jgi:hypothetical protein
MRGFLMRSLTFALILLLWSISPACAGHNEVNRSFTAATTARDAIGASPAAVNPGDRPGPPHYLPGNYEIGGALSAGSSVSALIFVPTLNSGGNTPPAANGFYMGASNNPYLAAGSVNVIVLQKNGTTSKGQATIGGCGSSSGNTDDVLTICVGSGTNTPMSETIYNASGGSSVTSALYFGNTTSLSEASVILNGAATTSGNGDNSFTLNGAAGMWLQGGGTNGFEVNSSGADFLLNQGTSGSIADAVCVESTGQIVLDASSTVCGLSDERLKNGRAWRPAKGFADACAELDAVRAIQFTWKPGTVRSKSDPGQHAGFGAWGVAFVDERLVARDKQGNPRAWRYDGMMALAVACEQEERTQLARLAAILGRQQSEISALKR